MFPDLTGKRSYSINGDSNGIPEICSKCNQRKAIVWYQGKKVCDKCILLCICIEEAKDG